MKFVIVKLSTLREFNRWDARFYIQGCTAYIDEEIARCRASVASHVDRLKRLVMEKRRIAANPKTEHGWRRRVDPPKVPK